MAKKLKMEDFSKTKLGKVINDDKEMLELLLEYLNNNKIESLYLSEYYKVVCEIINSRKEIDYDYCMLNNIGCGNFAKGIFCKEQYTINGNYEDPDALSYKLYLYQKNIIIDKINSNERSNCTKALISYKQYNFQLRLTYKTSDCVEKDILLSGDWIGKRSTLIEKNNCYELLNELHKLQGHVFWPSVKNPSNTVNQVRNDKISIFDTLIDLKNWYIDNNSDFIRKGLRNAFNDYKDYYLSFGRGEEGFNNYVDFWDIRAFAGLKECSGKAETVLSKQRFGLAKDKKSGVSFLILSNN